MIEDFPIIEDLEPDSVEPKFEPRATVQVIDGPNGQAIANIDHSGYAVTSGNQPSREAAIAKLAIMCFEIIRSIVNTKFFFFEINSILGIR